MNIGEWAYMFFFHVKFLSKKNVHGVLRFSNHMSYFCIKVMFEDSLYFYVNSTLKV
jgi:hypothetical protein